MSVIKHKIEKQSGLGAAGLIHILQNLGVKAGVRNKGFSKGMAKSFQEGFEGKQRGKAKQFLDAMVGGVGIPEAHIMREEFRHLGGSLSKKLREQGVDQISKRDLVTVRNFLKGDFAKGLKRYDPNNPVHEMALNEVSKKLKIDPEVIKKVGPGDLAKLKEAFTSKDSPMTRNIVSGLLQKTKKKSGRGITAPIPVPGKAEKVHHGAQLAGSITGNLPVAAIDPVTGGINISKAIVTNKATRKAMQKSDLASKALAGADQTMIKNPIKKGFEKGLQGKRISRTEKALRTAANAAAQEGQATANVMARAVPKHMQEIGGAAAKAIKGVDPKNITDTAKKVQSGAQNFAQRAGQVAASGTTPAPVQTGAQAIQQGFQTAAQGAGQVATATDARSVAVQSARQKAQQVGQAMPSGVRATSQKIREASNVNPNTSVVKGGQRIA